MHPPHASPHASSSCILFIRPLYASSLCILIMLPLMHPLVPLQVELAKGEALWLPAFTFHHVQSRAAPAGAEQPLAETATILLCTPLSIRIETLTERCTGAEQPLAKTLPFCLQLP